MSLGRHMIVELYECKKGILSEYIELEKILIESAKEANCTVLNCTTQYFAPSQLCIVVVIAESHIAFHGWPSRGYASLDFYTCGEAAKPMQGVQYILKVLECEKYSIMEMKRGLKGMLGREEEKVEGGQPPVEESYVQPIVPLPTPIQRKIWYTETHSNGLGKCLMLSEDLSETHHTQFHHIQVLSTRQKVLLLVLDHKLINSTAEETDYYEMMAHAPLLTLDSPHNILILGAGTGGLVKQALKHPSIQHITVVEEDTTYIDVLNKYFNHNMAAWEDERVEIVKENIDKFCGKLGEGVFDAIFLDQVDTGSEVYGRIVNKCKGALTGEGGIMVSRINSHAVDQPQFSRCFANYQKVFGTGCCHLGQIPLPSFIGGICLIYSRKGDNEESLLKLHPKGLQKEKVAQFMLKNGLEYYSWKLQMATYALPKYLALAIKEAIN